MWRWFAFAIVTVALDLNFNTGLAEFLHIRRDTLDMILLAPIIPCIIFILMRWAKSSRDDRLENLGQLLDAELNRSAPMDFLDQFDAPPWQLWNEWEIQINHTFTSRKANPQFWVFNLKYTNGSDDSAPYYRLTFIVVALRGVPPALIRTPRVPKGFTAMVSQNFLYLYETATWMGGTNFTLVDEIPAAVDQALAMAKVTPAGNGNPAWAEKHLFQ